MARIPFDIKYRPQIESAEYKVETRDGRPARIVCWDAKILGPQRKNKPILALSWHKDDIEEDFSFHLPNGQVLIDNPSPRDLFIVTPEPELTEFETAVKDCIEHSLIKASDHGVFAVSMDKTTTKAISAKLLILAKKELKSPWIPASNPPDHDMTILLCNNIGGTPTCIGAGHYLLNGMWLDAEELLTYPDYWMDIPELPKEE